MQRQGYSRSAVIIHWILAVSIFFLFISSWWMMGLPLPSEELRFRELPFQLHKNIGITLVLLLFVLLYVRFKHRPAPVTDTSMKPWMHKVALLDHILLYALILATCITGYLSSAHTRWDTVFWWLIEFPRIAEANEDLNEFWGELTSGRPGPCWHSSLYTSVARCTMPFSTTASCGACCAGEW
ncbi:MAG: cytochrome b/b6 domain-containing protein [Gammaproteobacteria bacterium]|nr:cytochrome b/b6 domain-containing protein [Gammaproteobacteria bacterium]